jgi:CDP-glucose 4,6-dehydratase
MVTTAYRWSFFNPEDQARHGVGLASVRAGNVIGGGDWAADRLVPDIVSAFSRGEPARIRRPDAIRPWQHVLEPLSGYLTLAERLCLEGARYGEAWNFGPEEGDAQSVRWIVKTMAELWGNGARWEIDDGKHPHEAACLRLDISRARAGLDWQPVLGLQAALQLVVDWVRASHDGANPREISMAQIRRYQALRLGWT